MVALKHVVVATVSNLLRQKNIKIELQGGIGMSFLDLVGFEGFTIENRADLEVDIVKQECIQTY